MSSLLLRAAILPPLVGLACSCSTSPPFEAEPAVEPPAVVAPDPESPGARSPDPESSGPESSGTESPSLDSPRSDLPLPGAGDLGELRTVEIATVGWDSLASSPIVLLRDVEAGGVLPIWIGLAEAQAIGRALHGTTLPRPMTHDLMADLLRTLGGSLETVVVHSLRGGTYYGLLEIRVDDGEERRWVDARPSDGLALALRTAARIQVTASLLAEQQEFRFIPPDPADQVVRLFGMTLIALDEASRAAVGLPADREGILVSTVTGDGVGRGLRKGDVILQIDGRPTTAPVDFLDEISDRRPGSTVPLRIWRDGSEIGVDLEIPLASSADSLVA